MPRQDGIIPVTETSAPRVPMHLRYLSLVRTNPQFRRLWMAQLISQMGDWFYSLAVYDLLLELTQSGKAVSWAIIIQTLPWSLMTPLSGHVADRFSRRQLMILADVARGFVVLGLMLVRTRSDVWAVYALLGFEVIFASIFEPARNAFLPRVVRDEEALPANALSSATWSLALTVGAAVGGLATALLGRPVAFVVNSLSFFVSALLIRAIRIEESHVIPAGHTRAAKPSPALAASLREAWTYFKQNPKVLVLALAKTGNGILGGVALLLAVFGERIFPIADRGALAMGLLYSARGVGAGLGPLVGDHLTRGRESRMWKSISISFFVIGISYLAFSQAPNLALAAVAVLCAHTGASNVWVVSTTLLQLNTHDRLRGRVFALDFGLAMLAAAASNYLLGVGLDTLRFTARELAAALGLVLVVPGVLWLPAQARWAKERL